MAPPDANDPDLQGVRAALALAGEGASDTAEFDRRLAADANDHDARFERAKALVSEQGFPDIPTLIKAHNVPDGEGYPLSKELLIVWTMLAAHHPLFKARGVRVNAVAPGEIKTAMLSPETTVLLPRIPLHRLGCPEDVAGTIFFLCSEDAAYITGTEISVNGGQHIY